MRGANLAVARSGPHSEDFACLLDAHLPRRRVAPAHALALPLFLLALSKLAFGGLPPLLQYVLPGGLRRPRARFGPRMCFAIVAVGVDFCSLRARILRRG